MPGVRVEALSIHPVKSMKGIALDSAELTPLGLAHDRRWMVVRENGRFVTQRDNARLALIETALDDDGLVLSLEGMPDLHVPWSAPAINNLTSSVWGSEVKVSDLGEEYANWLTQALQSKKGVRLVRMLDGFDRPGDPEYLGEATTLFADAAPYLVGNQATLEALNTELQARGEAPVPMNRFRPNIVVAGLPARGEHGVGGLGNTEWQFEFRGPCERCVVTTIDQDTAQRHPDRQPFRTLVDVDPMPGKPRKPAFGQHATLAGSGTIAVGQALDVIA